MKLVMIYGPSGIGKETIARQLAAQKGWRVFPQHLAFDVASSVIGFGHQGFEKYQMDIVHNALKTMHARGTDGVVLTFCYVEKASDLFMNGLRQLIEELAIDAEFFRLECALKEHLRRVTSEGRANTNKIQTEAYLLDYLSRFKFAENIPHTTTHVIETTSKSAQASAREIALRLSK